MYADHILNDVLNETILGVCYEVHRSIKKGTIFLDENEQSDDEKFKIVVENGLDVFGQPLSGPKKPVECLCPECGRYIGAVRFAPHLEKCMGMGRNSSRIASQRIANSGKSSSMHDGGDDDDDLNDSDWFASEPVKSKSRKRKADRNNGSPRASKSGISSKNKKDSSSGSSKGAGSSRISPTMTSSSKDSSRDQNHNLHGGGGMRGSPSAKDIRSENVKHTVTRWEEHINAALSGHDLRPTGTSNGIMKKSTKKPSSSKLHSKKSKKSKGGGGGGLTTTPHKSYDVS